jgi:hypothetical protein
MKWLLVVLVLLVVAVVGVGFYQGWFHVSTENADHHPNVTIGVDENKMQEDKKKVEGEIQKDKEKVEGLGQKAKDAPAATDKAKDQEPRP